METVVVKGLDKVVLDAVLHEYHDPTRADNVRPGAAILADLAVLEEGMIREYGIVNIFPLSDADPIVFMQQAEGAESRKALCYQQIYVMYLQAYTESGSTWNRIEYRISAWFEER
ncbi:hypothetical protein N7526_001985 [Penicillium atrosanguineum]|nr:hypothetical protein N7526_001985 [Penicillium atrosanguineum]